MIEKSFMCNSPLREKSAEAWIACIGDRLDPGSGASVVSHTLVRMGHRYLHQGLSSHRH